MQYAVITGESRGLGEAIAKQFIERNVNVVGVSRHGNKTLQTLAKEREVDYTHINCDLSQTQQLDEVLDKIVKEVFHDQTEYVYVVNNAGVIEPIETVGQLIPEKVANHIQINVMAPILMINRCLKEANDCDLPGAFINITSGAAERAVHGWSTYSSAKAAINRFTETVALEQKGKDHLVIAFSPGVIDTDMQGEIRSSSKESFAEIDKFKQLKEKGKLRSPDKVASVLMRLLDDPQTVENGKVYKLYDLVE